MTSESESTTSDEPWIPRWLKWSGLGMGVLCLLLVVAYFGLTWKWKADFKDQIQKLKQDGRPHSVQALQKAYDKRSSNQQDCGGWELPESLQEALHEIRTSEEISSYWVHQSSDHRRKSAKQVMELINKHQTTFDKQLDEKLHPCNPEFSNGIKSGVSHIIQRQAESHLFYHYAIALIETGKTKQVLPVLRTLYRRGRIIRQNPYIVSFAVGTAITSRANSAVKNLLSKREIPDDIRSIFNGVSPETMKDDLIFALESELVLEADAIQTSIQRHQSTITTILDKKLPSFVPNGLLWLSASNFVHDRRRVVNLFEKPYYSVKTKLKEYYSSDPASYYKQATNFYSHQLDLSYTALYEMLNDTKAKLELLQLATKAKLRSQNEGTRLTPIPKIDQSTDPYSGEPYKVKETESHVILYSVGKNLKDDGGSIEEQDGNDPKDVGVKISK